MKLGTHKDNKYFWVNEEFDNQLSPFFDSEEEAIIWYGKISSEIFNDYDVKLEADGKPKVDSTLDVFGV